jgi:hypothetical protein
MNDIATKCVADLKSHLGQLIAAGKVFHVYSEEELMDKTKGITFPAVGIVYEGMRAVPEDSDKKSVKMGVSAELVAAVMLIQRPDSISAADTKTPTMNLLDDIRQEIMGSKSPSGHWWKFVVEASANEKNGVVIWLQRWSTPVQLTPVK